MKKIVKVLAVLLLIINSSVSNIFADDTVYTEGDFNYVINDEGSIKIVLYFGRDNTVEVPRFIGLQKSGEEYVPRYVTTIGTGSFIDSGVKKVILPDTIVYIEEGAFDEGVELVFKDSEGNDVDQDVVNPIIIRPTNDSSEDTIIDRNDNSNSPSTNSSQGSTDNSIIYEEISNEYDTETGEEKDIWEITGEDHTETINNNNEDISDENEAIESNINETNSNPVSTTKYSFNIFGVIFFATAIVAVIYYFNYFKKK